MRAGSSAPYCLVQGAPEPRVCKCRTRLIVADMSPAQPKNSGGRATMGIDLETRIRNVTAVLGPTNTGKTHLAIERMLGHDTGMIGLPLRLLAREVYDKIVQRLGADQVA